MDSNSEYTTCTKRNGYNTIEIISKISFMEGQINMLTKYTEEYLDEIRELQDQNRKLKQKIKELEKIIDGKRKN
jgi:peptidoglycan hydrolase CwlO-like protein